MVRRNQAGFTLLEIVMAMAIASFIALAISIAISHETASLNAVVNLASFEDLANRIQMAATGDVACKQVLSDTSGNPFSIASFPTNLPSINDAVMQVPPYNAIYSSLVVGTAYGKIVLSSITLTQIPGTPSPVFNVGPTLVKQYQIYLQLNGYVLGSLSPRNPEIQLGGNNYQSIEIPMIILLNAGTNQVMGCASYRNDNYQKDQTYTAAAAAFWLDPTPIAPNQ